MAITPLGIITKASGALALASIALESNTMGQRRAVAGAKSEIANEAIKNDIGSSKLNYESPKYNGVKNFLDKYFPDDWYGFVGSVKGYFEGFANGIMNNLPTIGFGILALIAKHKPIKVLSLIGLVSAIITNVVANGTNLFENNDYLEVKK